jgi:putative effector of murein hydrolase
VLISGFYFYGESREFVELFAKNPKQFMLRKIYFNLRPLFIIFVPILIVALIFQPADWYYLIGALVVSILIQILTIIFKYGLFEENANLSRNSIIVFTNILFVIVPLFWPVPLIMGIRYYAKAQKNLKQYFHD